MTGNRTNVTSKTPSGTSTTSTFTYPSAGAATPHAVTSVAGGAGAGSYGYDAAGNQTNRPGQTVTYNEVGKVSKVVASSETQLNIFDADGNLLMRTSTTGGSALFLGDTTVTQAPGSTVIAGARTYSGAEGKPVAQRTAKTGTSGATLTWLFTTLEGTVDVQTNAATGATVTQHRDPFGTPVASSPHAWADGTGYMNKQVAEKTKLTNVGARTYDPMLGKFLSVDPIVDPNLPQQNTGYAYAGNNPTTYTDPTGLRLDEGCGWARSCNKANAGQDLTRHPSSGTVAPASGKCGKGDWTCRVQQSNSQDYCGGKRRAENCRSSHWATYDYRLEWPIVPTKSGWTPEEVMQVFKDRPTSIFPFTVQGCEKFRDGSECRLRTGATANPNGVVGVNATRTSVTFTVLDNGYFDAPGSTIRFSTYERSGTIYLQQDAVSVGSDLYVAYVFELGEARRDIGLNVPSYSTWEDQANNLKRELGVL